MTLRTHSRLLLALVLVGAVALFAQSKKEKEDPNVRNVQGVVFDPDDKPVPRAVVQLKDTRTLQVRSFITQAQGDFRFAGLRRDTDYELKATFEGMSSETKRLSIFDNRGNATVNLKLERK